MDLGGSGPEDGVTLSLTAVSSAVLQIQVRQHELGHSVLLLRPLEDRLVPVPALVRPPPGDGGGVETSGGSAGQNQI